MPLIAKLLAGLSSLALLATSGLGIHRAQADDARPTTQLGAVQDQPIADMSLDELRTFVSANIDVSAPDALTAAARFGALLAGLMPAGVLDSSARATADNAIQLMLELLARIYGPFDRAAAYAAADASFLDGLQPAAGQAPATTEGPFGPDLAAGGITVTIY